MRLLDDSALQQRAALSAALDGTNQSAPASASLVRVGRRYCSVYQLDIEGARLQSTRGGDAGERARARGRRRRHHATGRNLAVRAAMPPHMDEYRPRAPMGELRSWVRL